MDEQAARTRMVREQLAAREVTDPRVLKVMEKVPRHLFLPEPLQPHAYDDRAQPIGGSQTISQPLMVGLMTQLLEAGPEHSVLEIGTGSGYQTAILAEMAGHVITVERSEQLAARARELLEWMGYTNITFVVDDGSRGVPSFAPYDRIIVTAAAPAIPNPLVEQLAIHGRMVIPVGASEMQTLTVIHRETDGTLAVEEKGSCVFVPLVGEYGWSDPRS